MNNRLQEFEDRFKKASKEEYTKLLNEMESEFNIPVFNDERFNKNNSDVLILYKKISNARWD